MRRELEEHVFRHVSETIFITRAQFDTFIKKWVLKEIDGRFVWMQSGPEVHFLRIADGGIRPRSWLALANQCLHDYGLILCKIPKDSQDVVRFVERIGGQMTEETEFDYHYTIKGIPHAGHFHSAH